MRRTLFAVLLTAASASAQTAPNPAGGAIAPPLSPRNASYTIAATLDPSTHTVSGTETIAWRNITAKTATELQFHLYWNAWKNDRSTFMRERALGGGGGPIAESERSRIDVTSIRMADATVPTSQRFIAPDDGNEADQTVMAVTLPAPIGPGGAATIQVSWTAHVPRTFARTGVIGNFYFIAQWFPKLGVLQEDGWNCHQFHSSTEFFSDYGSYDVSLTVPRGWIVGATGVERDRRDGAPEGNATTHHYYQDDVHDFAWTTSPDFIERTAQFTHATLPPVTMRLLLQPEHLAQADRHFDATRTTLKYYGEWYGAYPYGHITIVDPAFQSGAGGMEYPTLFTAGTRWLAPRLVTRPEGVAVHEAGHQFWYGIVGNNEFEDAWLDEGFNQFSTARALAAASTPDFYEQRYFGGYIPYVFRDMPLSREVDENGLSSYRASAKRDAQSTPSFRYHPSFAGGITYSKTALWLNTMERWLGWTTMQRIMSTHFATWKFRHPKPQDFFDTVNATTGRDQSWYFDEVYRSSNVFDYGVQDIRSGPGPADSELSQTTVVVRRFGEAVFPVDVVTTFANGERAVERWDGRDRWKAFSYLRAARAVSAEVDPNRVLLLDVNWTNNSKSTQPQGARAATKWSLKWMVWLQDCLLSWAALV